MDNKLNNALNYFGLTIYESKIYTTLTSEGISTAKEISNICGIPYGKIYEVISSLSKKGFLEILPTKPMKYRAVDPQEIIKNVKEKAMLRTEKAAETVLKNLKSSFEKTKKFSDLKSNFWIINGRNAVAKKIEEMLKKSKVSLCIHTTEKGLIRIYFYKDLLSKLHKRGVNIKILTKITPKNKKITKSMGFCKILNLKKDKYQSTFISIDDNESLLFDSIPDDDNVFYGRDVGLLALNPSFTSFMNMLFFSPCQDMEKEG
jgi:sugar-specific transcriptional regulator TrmB